MVAKEIAKKFGVSLSTAKRKLEGNNGEYPAAAFVMEDVKDAKNRVKKQKDYRLADVKGLFANPKTKKITVKKSAQPGISDGGY